MRCYLCFCLRRCGARWLHGHDEKFARLPIPVDAFHSGSSVTVTVSPTSANVRAGATQSFSATVTGSSNTAVTWQVNGVAGGSAATGTISSSGMYTAPSNGARLQHCDRARREFGRRRCNRQQRRHITESRAGTHRHRAGIGSRRCVRDYGKRQRICQRRASAPRRRAAGNNFCVVHAAHGGGQRSIGWNIFRCGDESQSRKRDFRFPKFASDFDAAAEIRRRAAAG